MDDLVLRIPDEGEERARVLLSEWLATNGLGGYASGTLGGVTTCRGTSGSGAGSGDRRSATFS